MIGLGVGYMVGKLDTVFSIFPFKEMGSHSTEKKADGKNQLHKPDKKSMQHKAPFRVFYIQTGLISSSV